MQCVICGKENPNDTFEKWPVCSIHKPYMPEPAPVEYNSTCNVCGGTLLAGVNGIRCKIGENKYGRKGYGSRKRNWIILHPYSFCGHLLKTTNIDEIDIDFHKEKKEKIENKSEEKKEKLFKKKQNREYSPRLWQYHETIILYKLRDHYDNNNGLGDINWGAVARDMQNMNFPKRSLGAYRARINTVNRGDAGVKYLGFEADESNLNAEWAEKLYLAKYGKLSKPVAEESKPVNKLLEDVKPAEFENRIKSFTSNVAELITQMMKLNSVKFEGNEVHLIYKSE